MNWNNLFNRISGWCRKVGIFLWKTTAILLNMLIKVVAFIRRHWKSFGGASVVLIAVLVTALFILPMHVFLMFLRFVVAFGVVIIGFRKKVFCEYPRYFAGYWHKVAKIKNTFSKIISGGQNSCAYIGKQVFSRYFLLKRWIKVNCIPLFGIVTALVGFIGIMVQFHAQTNAIKKQHSAEQFKNAIEHLGSENQTIVLGGVHALHNLAMTFPKEYSQTVFDVLCSFIREETSKPEYQARGQRGQLEKSNVIQTIIDKLFREQKYQGEKAKLYGAFLCGVNFEDAKLLQADLSEAKLQRANFWGANLQGAKLGTVVLSGADFTGAVW